MTLYRWIKSEVPESVEIRQVSGFIFNLDGRILLLEDEGNYNLPGGKPEDGESLFSTFIREAQEEAQISVVSLGYLGYQLVTADEIFAQVRFVGLIDQISPSAPDPCTGRMYSRLWVPPIETNDLLGWGESGQGQITSAVEAASRFRLRVDGSLQA